MVAKNSTSQLMEVFIPAFYRYALVVKQGFYEKLGAIDVCDERDGKVECSAPNKVAVR